MITWKLHRSRKKSYHAGSNPATTKTGGERKIGDDISETALFFKQLKQQQHVNRKNLHQWSLLKKKTIRQWWRFFLKIVL